MSEVTFTLSVRNSKAIESADICLDQITVLTGVNASGKSTIARMWSQLINLSSLYPIFAERDAWEILAIWSVHIVQLKERLDGIPRGVLGGAAAEPRIDFSSQLGSMDFTGLVERLKDYTEKVFSDAEQKGTNGDRRRALITFLRAVGVGEEFVDDIAGLRKIFMRKVEKSVERYRENVARRDYHVYNQCKYYGVDVRWLTDVEHMVFKEGDDIVYAVKAADQIQSSKLSSTAPLREIFGLRDALYIASPWLSVPRIGADGVLRMAMDEVPHVVVNHEFSPEASLFKVLGGELEIDEHSQERQWLYKRSDGLTVSLNDCATGIKALSILDILYSRGYLNSETLLIIDEPEAHLHPQWIIEFARILVLIAKKLKVRMLLTSHNPDMVAALQKMSDVEGLDGLHFYMSKPISGSNGYKYIYEDLGKDIEPIFDMFNVAMDRIDAYGNGKI